MTHGKSPYELRAELLKLAFEILLSQRAATAAAAGKERTEEAISTDEVIEEATKLNGFVSTKGDRR